MESLLTVTTPATSFNLTTREAVKAELDLKSNDLNTWIDLKLPRLSAICSTYCRRVFAKQSYLEIIRPDRRTGDTRPIGTLSSLTRLTSPSQYIGLHQYPIVSIASVDEDGSALVLNTDYEYDPRIAGLYRLGSEARVPWEGLKTTVAYDAGFILPGNANANLPGDIEEAVLTFMKMAYRTRTRDPSLRSQDIPGVIAETYWDTGRDSTELPPEVASILDRHRRSVL